MLQLSPSFEEADSRLATFLIYQEKPAHSLRANGRKRLSDRVGVSVPSPVKLSPAWLFLRLPRAMLHLPCRFLPSLSPLLHGLLKALGRLLKAL